MLFGKKPDCDWLLVGLGNPGKEYARTRHNMGFRAMDLLAGKLGVQVRKAKFQALVAQAGYHGQKLLLLQPQTYMNASGLAVSAAASFYHVPPERIIVLFDDVSLPPGKIRIRANGSAGGHNGIKSVLAHVGDEHFARVRIGIGRPLPGWTVVNHVLAAFPEEDKPKIREAIDYLIPAVECIVTHDVDMAMNQFNPKKKKKAKKAQAAEASEGAEGKAREEHHEQAE